MEQHVAINWILFYGLGYIGLFYHVIKNALKLGKTLEALSVYVKQNSLSVLATLVVYNGVCAMWASTDIFSAFGLMRGELSAMTIPLAYMADSMFKDAVEKWSKKGGLDTSEKPDAQ